MFYLHIVLYNIKRNKWKSMITVGICIFVFLLLNLYLNNIYDCKIQLQNLPNISPVYCRVSNLNGSSEIGLEISEKLITDLESSTKIKDAAFSVRMVAGVGDFLIEDWKEKLNLSVAGANSIDAISGISLKNIHIEEDVPNFFTSSKPICIINKFVMEKNNLEVGDMVMLNLYYQYYDEKTRLHYAPLDLTPLEIIGTMDLSSSNTLQLPPDILIPFEVVREIFRQNRIDFYADSASFYVADPLQLNDFKEEMKSFRLLERVASAKLTYDGIALAVRDTTFRTLASQLRQSMDALEGFFPFIFLIVIFIGYITSFLLINSRQKEYALMRALGAGKVKSFFIFFLEQFFLVLLGELIGGGVAILIFTKILVIGLLMVIFLLLFYSHLFINNQKVRTAIERCLGVSKKNSKRSLIFGITLLLFLGSTIGCSMGGFLSRYISAENLNRIYYDSSYSNIADVEIKETILEERENMIVVFITILVSTTFIILLGGLISNYKINQNLKMEPMKLLSEKRNQ